MGVTTTAKVVAVSAVAALGTTFINPGQAGATSVSPIEITPLCASANSGQLLWTINNKNSDAITVDWMNVNSGATGSHVAGPGMTVVATSQTFTDGIARGVNVSFEDETNTSPLVKNDEMQGTVCTDEQLAAAHTQYQQPSMYCTNEEAIRPYLNVEWTDNYGEATITINKELPCDIDLYFSSYTMPDNYNGNGFENNPTALPQQLFKSTKIELKKGDHGVKTVNVELPDNCKNVQIDVYFGPEVTGLSQHDTQGHGTKNILSDIYQAEGQCHTGGNNQGGNPGQGGGNNGGGISGNFTQVNRGLTVEKTVEVTSTPASKGAELADTGASTVVPAIIASMIALLAAVVAFAPRRNRA